MPKLKKKITRDFATSHNTMLCDAQLLCKNAGLHMKLFEVRPVFRLYAVIRKI